MLVDSVALNRTLVANGSFESLSISDYEAPNDTALSYTADGRSTTVIRTNKPDLNFTGLYQHAKSGLDLATYRAYDSDLGRWISRDPMKNAETSEGPNLFSYVRNNPINNADYTGLKCLFAESFFTNLNGNRSMGAVVTTLIVVGDDGRCPICPYHWGEVLQAPLTVPWWKAWHPLISEDRLLEDQNIDVHIPYARIPYPPQT